VEKVKGEAFNIGTNIKTTIRELTNLIMEQYGIPNPPSFGNMPNRNWDVTDWYSNSSKAKELLGWEAKIKLADGLAGVDSWQKEVKFDTAFWNWNKQA
jgi:nucleoside-diphosphate-sugar epimerase